MTRKIRTMHAKVRSVARPYEPALGERLLMESHFARQAQTMAAPRLKVSDDSSGATEIAPDHPDPRMGLRLLAEALATTDVSFVIGLISQLADAGTRRRKVDERELNFMLSVVKGAKPKDQSLPRKWPLFIWRRWNSRVGSPMWKIPRSRTARNALSTSSPGRSRRR